MIERQCRLHQPGGDSLIAGLTDQGRRISENVFECDVK